MTYWEFIDFIKSHETSTIKGLNLHNSCSTDIIPKELLQLLPSVIKILEANLTSFFCRENQLMLIYGLQPCLMAFESTSALSIFPLQVNGLRKHLCCSIHYKVIDKDKAKINAIEPWQRSNTIIIDFTTGTLMDNHRYLSDIMQMKSYSLGKIFGKIDTELLNEVWGMVRKSPQQSDSSTPRETYEQIAKTGTYC